MNRYSTGPQGEAQPGSRGRVLRNLLGITSAREMNHVESVALERATHLAAEQTDQDHRFTAADIRGLHRLWLGEIYDWAGEYRSVNLSREGFMFASAQFIPDLMGELERGPLREYTPCLFESVEEQALAMAVVHGELVLIHPFREGNGRCARLLAILMGLQSGLPPLNFDGLRGAQRARYVVAIQAALVRDYAPLTEVFARVIRRTVRAATRQKP